MAPTIPVTTLAPPIAKLCRPAKRLPAATLPIPAWIPAAMEPTYLACQFVGLSVCDVRPREGSMRLTGDRPSGTKANREEYCCFNDDRKHNDADGSTNYDLENN